MKPPRLKICWWTCFPTANQSALVEALRRAGADVVVCYYRAYDDYRKSIGWRERSLQTGEYRVRSVAEARHCIADFSTRLQCVPSYNERISWQLMAWCMVHRVPWFASVERSRGSWKGWPLRWLFVKMVNHGAKRLFAIGKKAVVKWRELGVRSELVRWDAYAMPSVQVERLERAEGMKVRFAFVGALNERKAVDVLAEAWREVGDAELLVIGDGPLRGVFEGLVGVELAGALPPEEVQRRMAGCDVIVLPSRFDGWGVALAEGAQLGMAMIASEDVGASELIEPGVNGILVKTGDVASLAGAMKAYARDPEKAAREGEAARQAAERVSADILAKRILEELA